jgi:hypothetical protein
MCTYTVVYLSAYLYPYRSIIMWQFPQLCQHKILFSRLQWWNTHIYTINKQTLLYRHVHRAYTRTLIKKEYEVFLICKEFQIRTVAKSYMRKGFVIYEEMRKYLIIYEEAISHIWLCKQSILNFLIYSYKENFLFFFISLSRTRNFLASWFYSRSNIWHCYTGQFSALTVLWF